MQTTARKKPYKYLIQYLKNQGYNNDKFAYWLMTNNISLKEIQRSTNIILPKDIKEQFESYLEEDFFQLNYIMTAKIPLTH